MLKVLDTDATNTSQNYPIRANSYKLSYIGNAHYYMRAA